MIADPDPDDPDGLEVLRRFVQRDVPDEWGPERDSWLVACLIEARLVEDFWLRDDSPRGENATHSRYVFTRVPRMERERRQQQRANGWQETPIERERWLRDRRQREPTDDALAIYVCEIAPFTVIRVLSDDLPTIGGTEHDESVLHQLVDVATSELRSAGWRMIDGTVREKRTPAELGGQRVFDVVFAD